MRKQASAQVAQIHLFMCKQALAAQITSLCASEQAKVALITFFAHEQAQVAQITLFVYEQTQIAFSFMHNADTILFFFREKHHTIKNKHNLIK